MERPLHGRSTTHDNFVHKGHSCAATSLQAQISSNIHPKDLDEQDQIEITDLFDLRKFDGTLSCRKCS